MKKQKINEQGNACTNNQATKEKKEGKTGKRDIIQRLRGGDPKITRIFFCRGEGR